MGVIRLIYFFDLWTHIYRLGEGYKVNNVHKSKNCRSNYYLNKTICFTTNQIIN